MKNFYILLINSNTLLSRLIRNITKAEYTHASISISEEIFPFLSFGRKYARLIFPAGLKHEPFDSGFLKHYNNIPCTLFRLPVSEEQYEQAKKFIDNMFKNKKRYGFNLLGLIMCKFGIPIKRKRRMFCSEFVASVLNESKITNYKYPSLIQPIDFMKINGIECIYKGKIKNIMNIT